MKRPTVGEMLYGPDTVEDRPVDFVALSKRIKRDMRSLDVSVTKDGVVVKPVFQAAVTVTSWGHYRLCLDQGLISCADQESAW